MRKQCFYFFLFLLINNISAQNSIEFDQLNFEQGVYSNIIRNIQQDSFGNIWMATDEGLVKYNSVFSIAYTPNKGLPSNVSNRVNTIFIDSKDRIWIGVDKGVCLYNSKKDKFEFVSRNLNKYPRRVFSICEDLKGDIWLGCLNGIWSYDVSSKKLSHVEEFVNKIKLDVRELIIGLEGALIIGTKTGLYSYNISERTIKVRLKKKYHITSVFKNKNFYFLGTRYKGFYQLNSDFKILRKIDFIKKDAPVRSVVEDDKGYLYIGTDGDGIYKTDQDLNLVDHYLHSEDNLSSLSIDGVYDIFIDRQAVMWISTYGGGVNFMDKSMSNFMKLKHRLNIENSLANNFTNSIETDAFGRIWFATKKGVSIFDSNKKKWTHLKNFNNIVLVIRRDGNIMRLGTYDNGIFKVDITSLKITKIDSSVSAVYDIFKDSKGNIWYGADFKGLARISPSNKIKYFPIYGVRSILEFDNSIVIASKPGVFFIKDEKIIPNKVLDKIKKSNVLERFSINSILIGSIDNGLFIYKKNNGSDPELIPIKGLPSSVVQGIIVHNKNTIWASTTKGLAKIMLSDTDTVVRVYDKADGLASTLFNRGSYKKINDNLFAFGGLGGVTMFNPNDIKSKIESLPNVVFTEFSLFNKVIQPDDSILEGHINTVDQIDLTHSQNAITFKFVGISHLSSSKVKYSWILEGLTEKWSKPETSEMVNFTNLKYGNYIFKVKALNNEGFAGEVRSIKIYIRTPWWATSIAYFIYFCLFVSVFVGIVYVLKFILEKNSADEQIEFFNNLTHEIRTPLTILMSSLDAASNESTESNNEGNKRVKKTINLLNSLFEQMLDFRKSSIKKSEENISKIVLEKHIQKLISNFEPLLKENNLSINVYNSWSDEVFYFDIETLNKIIFNLVSNAVKYSRNEGEINLFLKPKKDNKLLLRFSDTGIGIPKDQQKFILKKFYRARNVINSQKSGAGIGLMMVKNLVEHFDGSISFKSQENIGTTFDVVIPNMQKLYKHAALLDEIVIPESKIKEQTNIDNFSDTKILIVEDNNELRSILVKNLEIYFQVHEAENGAEGLEIASKIFPDIILTDFIMPVMDGMEMTKALLKDISINHIPVFMMTVLSNSELKLESIESGVAEYIEKPLNINILLAKIIGTLERQSKLRSKYSEQSDKEISAQYRNSNDQDFITNAENIIMSSIMDTAFTVNNLNEAIGMSRTSLYMKFKSLIGMSPQDFVIHTRLKFAKKLLLQGQMTIKEISYKSGFSSPKYFSTSFKKLYGETPSSYLKTRN